MADGSWEDALSLYTGQEPTTREQVAGSGEGHASWFAEHLVEPASRQSGPPDGWDLAVSIPWVLTDALFPPAVYYYRVGLRLSPDIGSNEGDTPLHRFMSEPIDRLYGGASDAGTDMVKLLSFDSAVMAARGVHDHLMATHELITGMARDIDVPEAELQGSAAGALKDALTGIANEFEDLAVQMTTPREFTGEIDRARSQLRDSTMALSRAYETWRNSPGAWPAQRVIHLFHQTFDPFVGRAAQTVSGAAGPVIQTPLGAPADQGFWDRMEDRAKQDWKTGVVDNLDAAARTQLPAIDGAYSTAAALIPGVTAPSWRTPDNAGTAGASPYATGADGTATGAAARAAEAARARAEEALTDGGAATGDSGLAARSFAATPGSAQADDGTAAYSDDLSDTAALREQALRNAVEQAGSGALSTDGVGTGGLTATDGGTGYDGGAYPSGSLVNADGTVTAPGGGLLRNANGSPVKAPAGAYQTQQARIRRSQALEDAAKAQDKAYQEQLRRQQQSSAQSAAQQRSLEQSLQRARSSARTTGLDAHALETARSAGATLRVKQPDGSYTDYTKAAGETAAPRATRVRTSSVEPVTGAAEEAALSGRRSTASSGPATPPMGGGMSPGGAGQGQDRERKSYLDEDEDTWGTRRTGGTGVIG
ncbi:hypothetical protein OG233_24760 [Streptomyces sp. NBC_01218]|uniref:hypothetical protein n=1 Tax=Streptomyces sp. NBC_01218 TaxID=2903780 RepID=UPI002E0F1616|nr:hypothetical protein OG233_24760 [Streptomyces sp. NBC_01218]